MYHLNLFINYCKKLAPNKIVYLFDKNNFQSTIPLDNFNINTLRNTSLNIYLSKLYMYKSLYLYINIVIFYNNTSKKSSIIKTVYPKDANKYFKIDLSNIITPLDLDSLKLISIDISCKNGFLYLGPKFSLKAPFIFLEFTSYKNSMTEEKFSLTPPIEIPKKLPKTIEKVVYEPKPNNFRSLLFKFLNKQVKIKVEFNGTKILNGILDKITNNTIILREDNYTHLIFIDSISIIHTPEHIDITDLTFEKNRNTFLRLLNYLKTNNINIDLNDEDMNICTIKILNYSNSFFKAEDLETKKIYFFNINHIKTVEKIPII